MLLDDSHLRHSWTELIQQMKNWRYLCLQYLFPMTVRVQMHCTFMDACQNYWNKADHIYSNISLEKHVKTCFNLLVYVFCFLLLLLFPSRNMNPGNKGEICDRWLQVWYWILDRKYKFSCFVFPVTVFACLHGNELWWSVGRVIV